MYNYFSCQILISRNVRCKIFTKQNTRLYNKNNKCLIPHDILFLFQSYHVSMILAKMEVSALKVMILRVIYVDVHLLLQAPTVREVELIDSLALYSGAFDILIVFSQNF